MHHSFLLGSINVKSAKLYCLCALPRHCPLPIFLGPPVQLSFCPGCYYSVADVAILQSSIVLICCHCQHLHNSLHIILVHSTSNPIVHNEFLFSWDYNSKLKIPPSVEFEGNVSVCEYVLYDLKYLLFIFYCEHTLVMALDYD